MSGLLRELSRAKWRIAGIDVLITASLFACIALSVSLRGHPVKSWPVPAGIVEMGLSFEPGEMKQETVGQVLEFISGQGYAYLQADFHTASGTRLNGYYFLGTVPWLEGTGPGWAWFGSSVRFSPGETVTGSHGGGVYPAAGSLEKGAWFFGLEGFLSLNDAVIVFLDPSELTGSGMLAFNSAFLIYNAILVNPEPALVRELCLKLGTEGIAMNPVHMSDYLVKSQLEDASVQAFSAFSIIASFAYCSLCSVLCLVQLAVRRMREYCVHLLLGAGYPRVFLRLLAFNTAALAAPCAVMTVITQSSGFEPGLLLTPVCLTAALSLTVTAAAFTVVRREALSSILKKS